MKEVHHEDLNATIGYTVHSHHVDFVVCEGTRQEGGSVSYEQRGAGNSMERTDTFADASEMFTCSVKWDGCSHFTFGDSKNADGYLHLCGARHYERFMGLIRECFRIASVEMPNFNRDCAGTLREPPS